MWRALRAELAYSRPFLLGGLGIAAGVVALVSVVFYAVGDEGPPSTVATGLRGMFFILAPMIVGFITQGTRTEERRARLLLAGPLTPKQLAMAAVALPVVLFGIGSLAAGLVIAAGVLIAGGPDRESLNIVIFVGGQMFTYVQLGLLAQEASAAHHQRRTSARVTGWTCFVAAIVLLTALYLLLSLELLTWAHLILGHVVVAVAVMATVVSLYTGRTDFTR